MSADTRMAEIRQRLEDAPYTSPDAESAMLMGRTSITWLHHAPDDLAWLLAENERLAAQVRAVRELATEWRTHPVLDGHPLAQEVIDGLVAQLAAALGEG